MANKVVIIGGGIAGLSAAHHLNLLGIGDVHVYEASDRVGGKAKNQYVAGETHGVYPAEHGFRFFPHFYRHVVDTMRTTPVGGTTAFDLLVGSEFAGIAHDHQMIHILRSENLLEAPLFLKTIVEMLTTRGIGMQDSLRYGGVLLQFATSCQLRRDHEYDAQSWFEFAHADEYKAEFLELVIKASRNLSAMRAPSTSAATIGSISLQMIFDFEPTLDRKMDPVLPGPTEELWLQPWYAFLRQRGVSFHFGKPCDELVFDAKAGLLRQVRFGGEVVTADHYILAVPLDCCVRLLTDEMCAYDVSLRNLRTLAPKACGDMVGLQFYLRRDVPMVRGHVHYPKTPFALTSVSQGQFWATKPYERPDTPELGGIISVIISDWDTAGSEGLRANEYTDPDRLLAEVCRQLNSQLPADLQLEPTNLLKAHLDDDVRLGPFVNTTPLLIHPVGPLALRPDAETAIENLYLASDFVRTFTDLATMEGADEAARRAVCAIARRLDIPPERRPFVVRFSEGPIFDRAKLLDEAFYRLGLPHPMHATQAMVADARTGLESSISSIMSTLTGAIPHLPGLSALGGLPAVDPAKPDRSLLERYEVLFKQH
jgi:uncharacterized protein with NAD-binding domain and iron-sulfur cluster